MNSAGLDVLEAGAAALGFMLILVAIEVGRLHGWVAGVGFVIIMVIIIVIAMTSLCILIEISERRKKAFDRFDNYDKKSLDFHEWLKRRKQVSSLLAIENKIKENTLIISELLRNQIKRKYIGSDSITIWSGKNGFVTGIRIQLTSQLCEEVYLIAVSRVPEENNLAELNRWNKTAMANEEAFERILEEIKATSNATLKE